MSPTTPAADTLEARIARLERSGRRWRWLSVALGLVLIGVVATAAAPKNKPGPQPARVSRLEVVDAKGKVVAEVSGSETGGRLAIFTPDGKSAALIGATGAPGGVFELGGADFHNARVQMFISPDQSSMVVAGPKGKGWVAMDVDKKTGAASVSTAGPAGVTWKSSGR